MILLRALKNTVPGFLLAVAVALIALLATRLIPVNFIGAPVLAILIGIGVQTFVGVREEFYPGIRFTAKRVLKAFIILLGASMNISMILDVGASALILLAFTLTGSFLVGKLLQKAFGTSDKLTHLLSSGVAICGGSAISAVAPVIKAKHQEISYAITTIFMIDMVLIVLFPLVGQVMGLSDMVMGFWAGTSINDTSSVVAASFAYSQAAGNVATTVKLTRTLAIIPTVLISGIVYNRTDQSTRQKVSITQIFPWFIVFFIILAVVNTLGLIPDGVNQVFSNLRNFLMITALGAVGLNTNLGFLKEIGIKPFIHAVLLSLSIILISILVTFILL